MNWTEAALHELGSIYSLKETQTLSSVLRGVTDS